MYNDKPEVVEDLSSQYPECEISGNPQIPEDLCIICYDDEFEDGSDTIKNQLVSLCKCKHEPKHFGCLKKWIDIRIVSKSKSNHSTTYSLDKFECEVCKTPYPKFIQIENGLHA